MSVATLPMPSRPSLAIAAAADWSSIAQQPHVSGERRWRRDRIAVWAVLTDRDGCSTISAMVPDGTSPTLAPATGYLVADADLPACECEQPVVGSFDPAFCCRCAGVTP